MTLLHFHFDNLLLTVPSSISLSNDPGGVYLVGHFVRKYLCSTQQISTTLSVFSGDSKIGESNTRNLLAKISKAFFTMRLALEKL